MTTYTGISFAEGTSVGVGQVMEFYINFGTTGVIIGFLVLGVLIGVVDAQAGYHLRREDWRRFVLWYLPGLGFLQAGGSMVEVTSTVASSIFSAIVANKLLERYHKRREKVLAHRI